MKKLDENVSRRDLGKLALAAFGGVVAGSMLGGRLRQVRTTTFPPGIEIPGTHL